MSDLPGRLVIRPPTTPRLVMGPPVPAGAHVVPVAGPPGPAGDASSGHLGPPTLTAGEWVVTLTSNWGIDPSGNPYYDSAGAVPDEAAVASLDADGHLILTQPAGD